MRASTTSNDEHWLTTNESTCGSTGEEQEETQVYTYINKGLYMLNKITKQSFSVFIAEK